VNRKPRTARRIRWLTLLILAFTLAASSQALAAARIAQAVTSDQAATSKLLKAEYELVKATLARVDALETAGARAAKALGHECRNVLAGVPEESTLEEEGPRAAQPKLSGRAQGELARTDLEKQTIDMEIGETLIGAADRVLRSPIDAFIARTRPLAWSNSTITDVVRQKAARLRESLTDEEPCRRGIYPLSICLIIARTC
jgi:hypothetical protein